MENNCKTISSFIELYNNASLHCTDADLFSEEEEDLIRFFELEFAKAMLKDFGEKTAKQIANILLAC